MNSKNLYCKRNAASPFLILMIFCFAILSACQSKNEDPPVQETSDTGRTSIGTEAKDLQAPLDVTHATPTIDPASRLAATPDPAVLDPEIESPLFDLLTERRAAVEQALQEDPPILRLPNETLDSAQQLAESIALGNFDFLSFVYAQADRKPLRNEIFGVYPARESDNTESSPECAEQNCYRVEMYNYAYNLTTIALVNLDREEVSGVSHLTDAQPEAPPHLAELAKQIAMHAPEVQEALGYAPTEPTMANAKTALNQTSCESSHHFCVAPTFVVDDRALWAIVDLTEGRLVGVRWTYLGDFSAGRPDEIMIQREEIHARFCEENTNVAQDGWTFEYMLTSSDGLRVANVSYNNEPVVDSVKLVDWHVSYSQSDGFGYSDGIGCPIFSSSAVGASSPPTIEPILDDQGESIGFALIQDYHHTQWPRPCNYRYMQRYEFYADGSFRPVMINLGRGCGNQGVYRPILRVDLVDDQQLSAWDGSEWQNWLEEGWEALDDTVAYTDAGYRYRISNQAGSYFVEPGRGQFDDGRGDNAFVYVTRHNPDEGDADLITLGACCNTDFRQGPEVFIDDKPESTKEGDLVLWYVAQMENDDRPDNQYCWADQTIQDGLFVPQVWPCAAGPLFTRGDNAEQQ